jgi:hypothetical protein
MTQSGNTNFLTLSLSAFKKDTKKQGVTRLKRRMLISERETLRRLNVNMLITNNLQSIKGLSKMLIPDSETFWR